MKSEIRATRSSLCKITNLAQKGWENQQRKTIEVYNPQVQSQPDSVQTRLLTVLVALGSAELKTGCHFQIKRYLYFDF